MHAISINRLQADLEILLSLSLNFLRITVISQISRKTQKLYPLKIPAYRQAGVSSVRFNFAKLKRVILSYENGRCTYSSPV